MPTVLPPGACNAHCHVFGPRERFPYAADATFVPKADAPKEALFALNDRLGLERCVVVQSACHGFDNSATQDALTSRPGSYRGIALLPTNVDRGRTEAPSMLLAFAACGSTSWDTSDATCPSTKSCRWQRASPRSAGICRSMAILASDRSRAGVSLIAGARRDRPHRPDRRCPRACTSRTSRHCCG